MKKLLNILSVIVLMFGVVSSVRLVDMNQDLRSRASKEDGVTLCHKTGSESNPGQTITVNENAVDAHLEHGDSLGECATPSNDSSADNQNQDNPNQDNQEQSSNESENQNNQNQNQNEQQNNSNNNQELANTQEPQNNQPVTNNTTIINNTSDNSSNTSNNNSSTSDTTNNTASNPIQTATPTPNTFTFDIRPVTTTQGRNSLSVSLTFYQSGNQVYSRSASVAHRENGVFRGSINGINPGTYDVYLKTESHLGKVFRNVNVVTGTTNWNFSTTTLIAGDFDNDNRITIFDIGELLSEYTDSENLVTNENAKYDLNHDGLVDLADLNIVLKYYNSLSVEGDKL